MLLDIFHGSNLFPEPLTSEEEKLLRKQCFDLGITESEFFRWLLNDYMPNTNLNKEIIRGLPE